MAFPPHRPRDPGQNELQVAVHALDLHVWRVQPDDTISLPRGLDNLGITFLEPAESVNHEYQDYIGIAGRLHSLDVAITSTPVEETAIGCIVAQATMLRRLALRGFCGQELRSLFGHAEMIEASLHHLSDVLLVSTESPGELVAPVWPRALRRLTFAVARRPERTWTFNGDELEVFVGGHTLSTLASLTLLADFTALELADLRTWSLETSHAPADLVIRDMCVYAPARRADVPRTESDRIHCRLD